jgi:two-component system OmpR family response regulator
MADNTLIAVVEDDAEIRDLTLGLLRREGYEAVGCSDAVAFDRLAARRRVDLVLLDIMMSGEDGLSVCRRLRTGGDTAILMVTAKGDDIDRVIGLEVGADDYLAKPYNPRELLARVRAILRRTRETHRVAVAPPGEVYRFAGFTLNVASRDLTDPDGCAVVLTGGEHDLLMAFLQHAQRVLSRDHLLDWTRGRNAAPFDRSIDVLLGRLRRKLGEAPGGGTMIKTVRGGGYLFSPAVERL